MQCSAKFAQPIRQSRDCHQDTSSISSAGWIQQQCAHCNVLTVSAATNADAHAECSRGFQQLFAAGALCQTGASPCAILAYAYCHLTAAYLQQRLSACNCLLPRVPSYVGYTNAHCRLVTLTFCLLGTADLPSHVCPLVVFAASVMVDPCVAPCSLLDHPMVALSKLHERCSMRSFVWSCAAIADMTQPTQKTFDRLENHTCISTLPTTLWP